MLAAVYKHKSRGFQIRFKLYLPDGSHVVKYRYCRSSSEAQRVRRDCDFIASGSRSGNLSPREIAQARRDGLLSDADVRLLSGGKMPTVYDLDVVMSAYRDSISVTHTAVAFQKAYSKAMLISGWLKEHPIPDLAEADIKRYILDRREGRLLYHNAKTGFARAGVRPKTVSNELQIMTGIVEEARKLDMVKVNVCRLVSVPVKTSQLSKALSRADLVRFFDALSENSHLMHGQIYEFASVALYTGFRRSELRTLCWSDVDLVNRRICIQSKQVPGEPDFTPKSGTARSISIADKLFPILTGMPKTGRFVFGGDRPYHIDSISQTVRLVMRRAGLQGYSLHHLRHTFGSWLLRKTGDMKFVQDSLGHLDLSTTKRYMHTIEAVDQVRCFDYE